MGSIVGAPLPAGRIANFKCDALPPPARPPGPGSSPPITCDAASSGGAAGRPWRRRRRGARSSSCRSRRRRPSATLASSSWSEPPGLARTRHVGVGEQALLDRHRGLRGVVPGPPPLAFGADLGRRAGALLGWRPAEAEPGGLGVLRACVGLQGARGVLRVGGVLPWARGSTSPSSPGWRRCSGCRTRPGGPRSGRAWRTGRSS